MAYDYDESDQINMIIQFKQKNGKLKTLTPKECRLVENILNLSPNEQEGGQTTPSEENYVYTLNEAEVGLAKWRLEDEKDLAATALLRKLKYIGNEVWTDENGTTIAYKDGSVSIESFTFASFDAVFRDANANVENELATWAIERDPNINSEALTDYLDRSATDLVEMSMNGDESWKDWDDVIVCMGSVLRVAYETPSKLKKIAEVYLTLGGDKARAAMFVAKGIEDLQKTGP